MPVRLSEAARRERTGQRRAQILRAALDVFSRKGFHGATVRDIAARCGLAEGTLYIYFPSKQEILKGVFTLIAEDAASGATEVGPTDDDAAWLLGFFRQRIHALAQHAPFIRLVAHEADLNEDLRWELFARLHAPFVAQVREYLEDRIARGVFRPVNTAVVASICFRLMMSALMVHHVLELDPASLAYSEDESLEEMVALVLYGLVARPGAPAGPVREG